ncbi:transglycosylase SLT domain-containing protein [Aquamicrobium segne]|uniref:Transglycosylase SLT domain-containing protein n=1 Tax=Aquamicrobium segne TaxID=469547 RepID=A0ABW0GY79_9HYPH
MTAFGVVFAALGVSGCTTSQTMQNFAQASEAESDAGFTLTLPETVAVFPESALGYSGQNADLAQVPGEAVPVMALAAQGVGSGVQLASAASMVPVEAPTPATDLEVRTASRSEVDGLIAKYASFYGLPEAFVRRVVNRESTFNPKAYNNGHWGLMQIKHATARGMGYDGPAKGLLDAETNLKYSVKYLRGAWLVADGDENRADRLYQTGYYYHAKKRGMLEITGLGKDRKRRREPVVAKASAIETPQQVNLPVALNEF